MARRYGIKTRDITLLPIGGVARLERMPSKPGQELAVAVAGPAVNLAIAVVLWLGLALAAGPGPLPETGIATGSFLERLLVVNLFLVGFNLIPAFPMDGGRVLRSLLVFRLEYTRATQVAATVGQGLALLMALLGFFGNPFLIFIALFVWMGASGEARLVQIQSALAGIPVQRAMMTEFRTLSTRDSLDRAVELVRSGSQQDFPVVDDHGRVAGVLTRGQIIAALSDSEQDAPISAVMERNFQTTDSHEMLELAFGRLQTCDCHTLPVTRDGQLVGLLTMDSLGEFIRLQSAVNTATSGT
jgi:CBS domain-containing protein